MAITSARMTAGQSDERADGALAYAERNWYLFAVSGAVSAVIGVLVLVYPDPSLKLLGVFLGVDLLIVGVLLIVRGASSKSDPASGPAEILLGTLALIAGVIVVRNPGESLVLLAIAFAAYLIVAGALALASALVNRERRGAALAKGLVLVAAGTVIVAWPDISLKTLTVLAGISLILQGAGEIAEGFLLRGLRRADAGS